ncbi:PREDICTED: uncharacterized protein LOC109169564 [Ipomoea nil]|uniref:uncharacterized protein LOC109169564 n=1 Tax=Ipomoea nil TaxID=35883 RepID=UPI000900F23C|nr:PREDICTED: uncharacterized protein LOC109169564 [Ipomoea nil]
MMMMKKDDWIAAALMDDAVVVEMLFRLKQSYLSPASDATEKSLFLSLPPFHWGNRQPRSKPPSTSSVQKWSAARRSPTTPLSWSGGSASPSDGGCDESSRPPPSSDLSSVFRSKCTVTNEIFCNISSQRSKRKKTFAELKEEENSLLKERVHLERELASMHVTLNQQRARSDNLKKIKFDLNLESANQQPVNLESTKTQPSSVLPRHNTTKDDPVSSDSCRDEKAVASQNNRCFILPDLNMEPSEEEIGSLWD